MNPLTLHDIVFAAVNEICHDREYLYISFLKIFDAIKTGIYSPESMMSHGEVTAAGIKSELNCRLEWDVGCMIRYMPGNGALLRITIYQRNDGAVLSSKTYALSICTGDCILVNQETFDVFI